jgi:hypothetical protein
MITGGFYIKARKIQKSEISVAPPHIREVWDWLLMEANHSDNRYAGYSLKRGQLFRTYKDIREGLSWMVGWRKVMYNENQMKHAMKYLRDHLMITTTKAPAGVLVTICKYDLYQDPKNYERTNESTNESTTVIQRKHHSHPTNNKNVIQEECKNNKEEEMPEKIPAPSPENFNPIFIEAGEEEKKVPQKKEEANITNLALPICFGFYRTFYKNLTGFQPKIDEADGRAMKIIINYLKTIADHQPPTPTDISKIFEDLLNSYNNWEPFHQKQVKLTQINSNLSNIINILQNGSKTNKQGATANQRAEAMLKHFKPE